MTHVSKCFFLSLVLLFLSFTKIYAFSGNEKGNGGYAVVCTDPPPEFKSIEILDYVEGRILHDLNQIFTKQPETTELALEDFFLRMEKWEPTRVKLYRQWANDFNKEAKFLNGIDLGDIGDTDHIAIPDGCKLKLVINRREPKLPQDKRYYINNKLWQQLDRANQAGLILHELIYREMDTTTSVRARYLTAVIASDFLNIANLDQIIQLHKDVGLNSIDIQGVLVNLNQPLTFYANKKLKSAIPIPNSEYNYKNLVLTLSPWNDINNPHASPIEFFESGQLKSIVASEAIPLESHGLKLNVRGYDNKPILFWPNGAIAEGVLKIDESVWYSTPTVKIELGRDPYSNSISDGVIRLSPDSNIVFLENGRGEALIADHWVPIYRGFRQRGIELYDNSHLKSAYLPHEINIQYQDTLLNLKDQIYFCQNAQFQFGILQKPVRLRIQNKKVKFKGESNPIEFYPSGQLRCAYLAEATILESVNKTFEEYSYSVCFNEEGLVDPTLGFTQSFMD